MASETRLRPKRRRQHRLPGDGRRAVRSRPRATGYFSRRARLGRPSAANDVRAVCLFLARDPSRQTWNGNVRPGQRRPAARDAHGRRSRRHGCGGLGAGRRHGLVGRHGHERLCSPRPIPTAPGRSSSTAASPEGFAHRTTPGGGPSRRFSARLPRNGFYASSPDTPRWSPVKHRRTQPKKRSVRSRPTSVMQRAPDPKKHWTG